MLSKHLIAFLLSFRAFFCPCDSQAIKANGWEKAGRKEHIPKLIEESSGLEVQENGMLITVSDGGNPAILYRIARQGELLDSLHLPLKNHDWESLAQDDAGNLYVGDFGNNFDNRKNLAIYKIRPDKHIDTIRFSYPEQQEIPSPKKQRYYDCEAMFWQGGKLHLFTKSRSGVFTRHYILPDSAGKFLAELHAKIRMKGLVTAADISPDSKTVVLLTYGKLYFFDWDAASAKLLEDSKLCLRYNRAGQSEAVIFVNNEVVGMTNETGKLVFFKKK